MFTLEKVCGQSRKITRPEEARVSGFQAKDAIERIFPQLRFVRQTRIERAEHLVLVANLRPKKPAGELRGALWTEAAEFPESRRVHILGAGRE